MWKSTATDVNEKPPTVTPATSPAEVSFDENGPVGPPDDDQGIDLSVLGAYSKTDPDIPATTADDTADASKVKLSLGGDDAGGVQAH